MSVVDKYFYNQASRAKLGWEMDWFDASDEGELIRNIRAFQKKCGLSPDGLCGPTTFRRIWTEREANASEEILADVRDEKDEYFIICNGKPQKIDHPTVVWTDKGGFQAEKGTFTSFGGKEPREIKSFVNHWDVCLSAKSCARVLDRRGISVHFLIDNDGTIYQTLDTQHAAWQAGNRAVNLSSVGVEISCAYYPKYQERYKKMGFGERPVVKDAVVHGKKLDPYLGFYDAQVKALKALWKAIHEAHGVPYKSPLDQDGSRLLTSSDEVASGKFEGFVNHFHITRRKIDCAHLDIPALLKEIKDEEG